MGDTKQHERELLKKAYPTKAWADKVNKMSDAQVFAVFMRLREQKRI